MSDVADRLIHRYLDGALTAEQEAGLNAWVKADPANAARFAAAARLHDRLRDVVRTPKEPSANAVAPPRRAWRPARYVGGLTAAVAVACVAVWWASATRVTAATELDRLIASAAAAGDRTYVVRSLDPRPEPPDDRRPPIDGATLHVRPPDQYVLVRQFPDGRTFVTGSDGQRSWAVPPDGAVRVSGDALRFRGPVPGHQSGLPFADLRADLVELRAAYDLTRLGADAAGRRGLRAYKKSEAYRGPNRVDIWYDPATGVIGRMEFDGLPRARGGPDRVAVDMVEQRPLGPDFFRHDAHHGPGRRVIEED